MGYYADTDWDITFHSPEAEQAAYAELRAELGWTIDDGTWLLANVGENAEQERDGLNLSGSTSGKFFYEANRGMDIIAKYADGEIRLDASDSGDGHCKYVLSGGTIRWVDGYIAYRDPQEPRGEVGSILLKVLAAAQGVHPSRVRSLAAEVAEALRDDRSPWDEIDGAPVADWQYEVANGDTRLGYLAWADAKKEQEGAA